MQVQVCYTYTHVDTVRRRPKLSFPYLCFDSSEVMFVNITSGQSKQSYRKLLSLHVYPMKSLVLESKYLMCLSLRKKQVISFMCSVKTAEGLVP